METLTLRLSNGEARLKTAAEPFDTVIVGNPEVVTTSVVNATALVLTAQAEGRTNVILLNEDGRRLSEWSVIVDEMTGHRALIYRGTTRSALLCNPDCRPTRENTASESP